MKNQCDTYFFFDGRVPLRCLFLLGIWNRTSLERTNKERGKVQRWWEVVPCTRDVIVRWVNANVRTYSYVRCLSLDGWICYEPGLLQTVLAVVVEDTRVMGGSWRWELNDWGVNDSVHSYTVFLLHLLFLRDETYILMRSSIIQNCLCHGTSTTTMFKCKKLKYERRLRWDVLRHHNMARNKLRVDLITVVTSKGKKAVRDILKFESWSWWNLLHRLA